MAAFRYFSFIIASIIFQSLGGIFGKYAAISLPAPTVIGIFTNAFYILSIGCLFFQAIVWQQALMHFPLSVAYPYMALVSFVVLISSAVLFHEGVTPGNIIGLVIISAGIVVLSRETGGGA
jgi:multidrug transporter EmrE-like cation transporter